MNRRFALWGITALTLIALVIDLPKIPLKFHLGSWNVNTTIQGPDIDLTRWHIPYQKELNVKQGLDLKGGTQVTLSLDMSKVAAGDRQGASDAAISVLQNRVNYTGATEAVVQPAKVGSDWRAIVELPGVSDAQQAVKLVGQTAQLEFREFTDAQAEASRYPTMETTKSTGITGKDLERAVVQADQQTGATYQVAITFTPEGQKKFADLTTRLTGKPLPIFLDQLPLTAPTVNEPIRDGKAVINGSFTADSARQLALQLSAGALPVPIKVVEQRTIGATLGQASIQKSMVAGAVGLVLIMLFMALNYGRLGLVADLALTLYTLFALALFKWIPITITLAGIAGFILSIGMAVDANILIFERFREELRRGNKTRAALEIAFRRAWSSIRDSNISTLITCAILYFLGTGLVRGFALTLGVGVLVSLFTAVVVTRTFLRTIYGGGWSLPRATNRVAPVRPRLRPAPPVVQEGGV